MIKNVQALRFLAAAWVALFHLHLMTGLDSGTPWLATLAGVGYA